jgi:hypothetical protein
MKNSTHPMDITTNWCSHGGLFTLDGKANKLPSNQCGPTPTSAPTWMDDAHIKLCFLSMRHAKLIFFACLLQTFFLALILVFFF